MGLGFLSPLFLLGLAAVAVPVLLHLFSRRPETVVPFSAVRFIRQAPVEQRRRLRHLREWLLLALRATALALLALAFARPYFVDTAAAGTPATILALDASASVSTPGQRERLLRLARRALDDRGAGEAVGILQFDDRATVLLAPTTDRGAARSALGRYAAGSGGTRYSAALAAAADLLDGRPGRLIVISDLQRYGWPADDAAVAPASLVLEAKDVGAPGANAAVTAVRRVDGGLAATVRYVGAAPRRARVVARANGTPIGEQTIILTPGAAAEVTIPSQLPPRGVVELRVDDGEGPAADDARFLLLDRQQAPRVLIVVPAPRGERDAFYLARALDAVRGPEALSVEIRAADRLAHAPDSLAGHAAVIVTGTAGLDRRLGDRIRALVSSGAGLLVLAGPSLDPRLFAAQVPGLFRVGPVAAASVPLTFAAADPRHPVFGAFGAETGLLASVRFARAAAIEPSRGQVVLARFSDGRPALVEAALDRGRALFFASDLGGEWNDFVRRPAFVPFVHALVRYAAAGRGAPGEYRVGEWPGDAGRRPGVVDVPAEDGRPARRVVVNVDPREADAARMTPAAFVAAAPRAPGAARPAGALAAQDQEASQSLWRYGLALMLLGLVAESLVGRRV